MKLHIQRLFLLTKIYIKAIYICIKAIDPGIILFSPNYFVGYYILLGDEKKIWGFNRARHSFPFTILL